MTQLPVRVPYLKIRTLSHFSPSPEKITSDSPFLTHHLKASQATLASPDEKQGEQLQMVWVFTGVSMAGAQGEKQTETVKEGGAIH